MGKVLCYSVKIKRIEKITHKSYKIFSFNGMVDILPASQIYGIDTETKGLSYWVAAWILEKRISNIRIKRNVSLMKEGINTLLWR